MMKALITLFTNEAAASSCVLCCPTMTVSASPVTMLPSCPIMIGTPSLSSDFIWNMYSLRLSSVICYRVRHAHSAAAGRMGAHVSPHGAPCAMGDGGLYGCRIAVGSGRRMPERAHAAHAPRCGRLGPRVVHATKRMKLILFGFMLYKILGTLFPAANIIQEWRSGKSRAAFVSDAQWRGCGDGAQGRFRGRAGCEMEHILQRTLLSRKSG